MMRNRIGIVLGLAWAVVSAQTSFNISASVNNLENTAVSVGDALLFKNDSLFRYIMVADGKLFIESVPQGNYLLRISCLGFETEERILKLDKNISLDILLKESTTNLDEVELVAAKPIFTNTNGNLKIDVMNPVFASIPDPMELISKLPGIQVSRNRESLTVLGKGSPLLYVGNQRITLEEFYALSVDSIHSIEIIKNPSSKYEAEGRAVLLINLKINDTEGAILNFSETLSFKQNFNNYNSLNGSLKRKKLVLKANLGYNDLQTWESHTFAFGIPDEDIFSDYRVLIDKNDRVEINTGGGLLYQINETDYFSLNSNIRLQANSFPIDTETYLRQQSKEDFIMTKTTNDNTRNFGSGNFNYNAKLTPRLNLFTGLQYSSYVQKMNSDVTNKANDIGFIKAQKQEQKYGIDIWAYRLDLEKEFDGDLKFELGANISNARANASNEIQFLESGRLAVDDYTYSENTYATYTQISGSLHRNINFSAGLRMENNQVKGEMDVDSDAIPLIDRDNTRFFPKAMLDIKMDSTKNLTLNYSKSIERPEYVRATSIKVFINPFLEGSGNVNLLPTVTQEVSASFQLKQKLISIIYFQRKNPMYFTIGYEDGAENAVFSLRNLEAESGLDISLTIPITKGIWTATNMAMLSTKRIEDSTAKVNASKPYLYVYADHQFKIGKDTIFSVGGWGTTKSSEGIFERNGLISLHTAITKTFFDKLHCSLRFNDIARAQTFEEGYSINGVNANGFYFSDAQEIALSLKYALGKIKEPDYKNKDVDENLNRIR